MTLRYPILCSAALLVLSLAAFAHDLPGAAGVMLWVSGALAAYGKWRRQ